MATIEDVAEEAGVSKSTVSHVINDTRYVSPELTEKVKQAMDKLDYHSPNAVARGLAINKTNTIGVIVSDITNLFFPYVVRGLEDIALEEGYSLTVFNTDEKPRREKMLIDTLVEQRVDGVVISPTGKADEKICLLRNKEIPFVLLDRNLGSVRADFVTSKNFQGAQKATKYLIDQGHNRIGLIRGPKALSTSNERFRGYKKTLQESGIGFNEKLVVRGNYKLKGGENAVEKLFHLDSPPTALFSTNLMSNFGALKTIKRLGYNCPRDCSIIGFDDLPWMEILQPPLTTIKQQPYEMGYRAGQMLFKRITENNCQEFKTIKLGTELIVRDSVKNLT